MFLEFRLLWAILDVRSESRASASASLSTAAAPVRFWHSPRLQDVFAALAGLSVFTISSDEFVTYDHTSFTSYTAPFARSPCF